MNETKIKLLGKITVKNIDQYLDSLKVSPKTKKESPSIYFFHDEASGKRRYFIKQSL